MFNDGNEMFHDLNRTQLILPYVKAILTKGIWQRLLEANYLRSKSPTTASDLLSLAGLGGGHRPASLKPKSTAMSQIS